MPVSEIAVRQADPDDHDACVMMVRDAFWNRYKPGADEHFLWHREVTGHPDVIDDLTMVATVDEKIVGCVMSTVGHVIDERETDVPVLVVGPLCAHVDHQRAGVGSMLMEATLEKAKSLGYPAAFLYGSPEYYRRFGFQDAETWHITTAEGDNFPAFMARELAPDRLSEVTGRLLETSMFENDPAIVDAFDAQFPPKMKEAREGQL